MPPILGSLGAGSSSTYGLTRRPTFRGVIPNSFGDFNTIQYLIVAGGGGGAGGTGGGGGAGAMMIGIMGVDRKSTRLNSSHSQQSRMPSSA